MADVNIQQQPPSSGGGGSGVLVGILLVVVVLAVVGWLFLGGGMNRHSTVDVKVSTPSSGTTTSGGTGH